MISNHLAYLHEEPVLPIVLPEHEDSRQTMTASRLKRRIMSAKIRNIGMIFINLPADKKTFDMKTIRIIVAAAAIIAMALTSCGNAGAKTDGKKQTKKGGVIELNAESFGKKVYDIKAAELVYLGDKPAIVDFTASWCGPCQRISPILEELAAELGDKIVIYKVDIDKNNALAREFNISSIPAILYIPLEGESVMTIGSRGKTQFMQEISTYLLNKVE